MARATVARGMMRSRAAVRKLVGVADAISVMWAACSSGRRAARDARKALG